MSLLCSFTGEAALGKGSLGALVGIYLGAQQGAISQICTPNKRSACCIFLAATSWNCVPFLLSTESHCLIHQIITLWEHMLFCSSFNFQVLAQCLAHTESQIFILSAVEKICYSKTYLRNFALKTRKMFYSLKSVLPWMSPSNLKRVCDHIHPPTMGGGTPFQNCSLVSLPRLPSSVFLLIPFLLSFPVKIVPPER